MRGATIHAFDSAPRASLSNGGFFVPSVTFASVAGSYCPEEKMIVSDLKHCNHCHSLIVAGQRWVRQKVYDPCRGSREVAAYHHYHAEPFLGQGQSCWEKHQMELELARAAA